MLRYVQQRRSFGPTVGTGFAYVDLAHMTAESSNMPTVPGVDVVKAPTVLLAVPRLYESERKQCFVGEQDFKRKDKI